MTLAGFKATNHPQQTAKRDAVDAVDDRGTNAEFMAEMVERFGVFDMDVAAAEHNAKAERCNPPYSDCGAWVSKAWREWYGTDGRLSREHGLQHARDAAPYRIVMLLPANRVEQAWWQEQVEPFRDRTGSPLSVEFLRGRMRFDRPGWTKPAKGDRPPFGCCLLIWTTAHPAQTTAPTTPPDLS